MASAPKKQKRGEEWYKGVLDSYLLLFFAQNDHIFFKVRTKLALKMPNLEESADLVQAHDYMSDKPYQNMFEPLWINSMDISSGIL